MSEMINGTLLADCFATEVTSEAKTTTIEGFLQEGEKVIRVRVELTDNQSEGDLSPVFNLIKAEPINFIMIPHSFMTQEPEEELEAPMVKWEVTENDCYA